MLFVVDVVDCFFVVVMIDFDDSIDVVVIVKILCVNGIVDIELYCKFGCNQFCVVIFVFIELEDVCQLMCLIDYVLENLVG